MNPLDGPSFEPDERWTRAHAAAKVIESARQMAVPKLTQRAAAESSGIDPTYWPVVVRGWRSINQQQVALVAPDDTLLRMARAVGVESEVRILLGLATEKPVHVERASGTGKYAMVPQEDWDRLSDEQRELYRELIHQSAEQQRASGEPPGPDM